MIFPSILLVGSIAVATQTPQVQQLVQGRQMFVPEWRVYRNWKRRSSQNLRPLRMVRFRKQ